MVVLLIIPFLFTVLSANEEMMIQSNEVDYQGKEIILEGNVHLKQPLGDLTADRAVISSSDQKVPSIIQLDGNVLMVTAERGTLAAQKGNIDCQGLRATFFGSETAPHVTYTHDYATKKNPLEKIPLALQSSAMVMTLKKEEKTHLLDSLEAEGEVKARFNNEYEVNAERARYDHSNGKLHLYASEDKSIRAQVRNFNDWIQSDSIELNTQEQELTFDKAQGALQNQTEFSADELIWNDKEHRLILKSNVYLKQQGVGDLTTPHSVIIIQKVIDGKKEIRSIEAEGEVVLTYVDNKKGFIHHLNCSGPMRIDNEKFQVFMQSSDGFNQEIPSEKQVHFSNLMGDIYADQAILTYKMENEKMMPNYLHMEGHVKLINRFNGHEKEVGLDLQNVLADSVDYFLDKREMHLSAHAPNRVLLFDRVKNMQMSAPAFIMTFDETLTKPTIRGLGQTRLKFADKELEQMKHYFNIKDTP